MSISKKKHLPLEIKYGGIYAKELKRVKELEHENYKLKKMYAELVLLNNALDKNQIWK